METFSQKAWKSIDSTVYKNILDLDFIKELMNGSLDKSIFEFYIKQDKLYLQEFARILTMISAKLPKLEESTKFLIYSKEMMEVERELHKEFLKLFEADKSLEASPSCLLYTGYLHQILNTSSLSSILASVLPCFWIYQEVGKYIIKNQNNENNPYQSWINTYADEEYENVVNDIIKICDSHALSASKEENENMLKVFHKASQMEYIFWESAYKKEKWII